MTVRLARKHYKVKNDCETECVNTFIANASLLIYRGLSHVLGSSHKSLANRTLIFIRNVIG